MNTLHAVYIAVAAALRTAALAIALYGLFAGLLPLAAFMRQPSFEVVLGVLRMVVVYFIAAFVVWRIAKPAASLVVRGLDAEE